MKIHVMPERIRCDIIENVSKLRWLAPHTLISEALGRPGRAESPGRVGRTGSEITGPGRVRGCSVLSAVLVKRKAEHVYCSDIIWI